MEQKKYRKIISEIFLLCLQILFSKIKFFGIPNFIGFPFAVARVINGANLFFVSSEIVISGVICIVQPFEIFIFAYEIIILSLYYFLIQTIKVKHKNLIMILFIILSSVIELYMCAFSFNPLLEYLISLVLKIVFCFYFLKVFSSYRKKMVFNKISNFDYLYFILFVSITATGLFQFDFILNYLGIFIVFLELIFLGKLLPTDKFLLISLIITSIYTVFLSDFALIIYFICLMFLVLVFGKFNKYFYLSLICSCVLTYHFLFNKNDMISLICFLSSIFICLIIPQKTYFKLSRLFEQKTENIIAENYNQEKNRLFKNKLISMSKTFLFMAQNFRSLIIGKIDKKSASNELACDLYKFCEKCENFNYCQKSIIDKKSIFAEYISYALSKGCISEFELGVNFKTYCIKQNQVVAEINKLVKFYKSYEQTVKNEDESKLLIAMEFENFASLFNGFVDVFNKTPKLNKQLSSFLKQVVLDNMIDLRDIAVYENKNDIEKIDVVADNELILRRELKESLQKTIKTNLKLVSIKHLDFSGISLATFIPFSNIFVEIAVSTQAKENVNGDNVSVIKIDENRYFIALADGMGHGKVAGRISNMVLELVKSMFVIGIDKDIIINSINRLLLPVGLDNFSSLDACVVDLKEQICSFIKLGASVSILKHTNTSEIISCESLPIGIVQNINPTIISKRIFPGDIVFLASDGVVDSFKTIEDYKIFINDSKIKNVQNFVDGLIFDLKTIQSEHKDDMSLIAIKLLKKI